MKSLRSTGSSRDGARGAQVVERAAEVERLGQDRQRRGAAALVGPHDLLDRRALADARPPTASGACARRSARCRAAAAPPRTAVPRAAGRAPPRAARERHRRRAGGRPRRACPRRSAPARSSGGRQLLWSVATEALERRGGARRRRAPPRPPARPPRATSAAPADVDRGAGVERRQVARRRRARPAKIRRVVAALSSGVPPASVGRAPRAAARRPPARPRSERSSGPSTSTTRVVPDVLISSRPSSLDTTSARGAQPRQRARDRVEERGVGHPDQLARRARRVGQRPEEVEDRAHASSLRTGTTQRVAPWWAGANMKPKPTCSMQRATASGPRSIRTPSASSTSAEPDSPVAERLPCLATAQPAPAAISAAVVETLKVGRPPPVPPVSSRSSRPVEHRGGERAHGGGEADQLVDRLALGAQRDQHRGDLGLGRVAGHDLGEHAAAASAERSRPEASASIASVRHRQGSSRAAACRRG